MSRDMKRAWNKESEIVEIDFAFLCNGTEDPTVSGVGITSGARSDTGVYDFTLDNPWKEFRYCDVRVQGDVSKNLTARMTAHSVNSSINLSGVASTPTFTVTLTSGTNGATDIGGHWAHGVLRVVKI